MNNSLLGFAEVAALLNLSKSRTAVVTDKKSFPPPMIVLAATPVWRRKDVEKWVAGWDRRGGGKRRVAAE